MQSTLSQTSALYEKRKQLVPNALGIFNPSSISKASGAIITDADGKSFIDFAGGIGVINAGHCPEPVVKAIQEQSEKFIHACFNVSIYEQYLNAAEKMIDILPHGEHTKIMFTNSGAEAVENAIKIARQATKREAVICYSQAFHGRTLLAATLTSKVGYKTGFGPFAPEIYRIDFPAYDYYEGALNEDAFSMEHIEKLKAFFHHYVPAQNVAAIIVEPVQGEGGFHVIPKKYLQELRKICTDNGIMLILDEVQTGFGRTGEWAAFHHYDIVPDLSTWAKSMGSGMPIGAVMGKADVMDNINPGTIGGTYLGNALCCVAVSATIDYMQSIDINTKGKAVGAIIKKRFQQLQQKFPNHISRVRGLGAMMAFELSVNGDIHQPDTALTKKLAQRCYENGLIVLTAGVHGNVIRNLAPLVISETDLNRGLDIIENCLAEIIAA
ncbi:MAG: aspartate aminotransferase family protein [Bacteroidetes bacterium]|jgi:4-aminobutyrate aminotransferase/(S)-3-amino-2-methylpropionate transaminase|nr:aspartate aminotransferase family protein [Bacteroidota bacterium]MBL0280305.1 aspartate aminotransferase family protein [Bacteroidota bacterium]